jgi:hypothetical protein
VDKESAEWKKHFPKERIKWEKKHPIVKTGHYYNVTREYKIYFRIRSSKEYLRDAFDEENDIAYYDTEKRDCFVWGYSIDKDFKRERENFYADTIEEALDSMKRLGVDITVDD